MTVYVDDMYLRPMGQFGKMKMSHMISDNLDELHAMADAIGIKRKWFQNTHSGPHYDIAISKRKLAISKGVIEVTLRELAYMSFVRRVTGRLPKHYLADIEWRRLQRKLYLQTVKRKAELRMRAKEGVRIQAVKARILREPRIRIESRLPI
jgi:hypothetical protein